MDGLLVPIEELRQAEGRIAQLEAENAELVKALTSASEDIRQCNYTKARSDALVVLGKLK